MNAMDIQIDNNGLPIIVDGDLVWDTFEERCLTEISLAKQGHFKHFPIIGIGLRDYQNAPETIERINELKRLYKVQLQADGYKEPTITGTKISNIKINASR